MCRPQLSQQDGGVSAAPLTRVALFYGSRLLFDSNGRLLIGVWHKRRSAHELTRWQCHWRRTDKTSGGQVEGEDGADPPELRPIDSVLPTSDGLCVDAWLVTGAGAGSESGASQMLLYDSQTHDLLLLECASLTDVFFPRVRNLSFPTRRRID